MSKKAQHDYYYNTNYEGSGPSAPPIEDFASPFSDPIDSKTENGPAFNPNVPPVSSSSLAPPHENPFYTPGPQTTGDYMPYDDTEPLTNPFAHYQDDELLPPPPDYSLYRAVYSTHKNGVTSRDRHINQDGEALVQFLYENNTPPRLKVKLYGHHKEVSWVKKKHNGEVKKRRKTKRVVDFNFEIDLSAWVSPRCLNVAVLPDPKTGQLLTVRGLCDEYIADTSGYKELKLSKEISWNEPELTKAFTLLIREHGYRGNLKVTYNLENERILVRSHHYLSNWTESTWAQTLYYVSMVWIIAEPILWLCRNKFGHSTLRSQWRMIKSEEELYRIHADHVKLQTQYPSY